MKDTDIRVRMVALLITSVGILVIRSEYAVYLSLLLVTIWTGLILGFGKVFPQIILFASLELALFLIRDVRALGNLPLLLVYLRRLIIAVIAAYPVAKAPTGKLIASLDKLKIPRTFTISLAVLLRFLPTVGMEYSAIRRAQRYRGIGISPGTVITRIPQLFEYTLVPLLIRTTKVADELTASAEVRGMKLKGDYNPYYEVKMRVPDRILLIVVIMCETGIYYVDYICGRTM